MPLLLQGDCLKQMQNLDDNSVDSIVTDPPYGIKFMAKKWDHNVPNVEIWQEALRVLKPGGHLLCACGTRTQHRMVVNIEDAGFEIRDVVTWMYGSGFPKSLNIGKAVDKLQGNDREVVGYAVSNPDMRDVGKKSKEAIGIDKLSFGQVSNAKRQQTKITKGNSEYEGWGTALKPACEFFTLARKPLSEKTVAENVLKWGTGGINIDDCRVDHNEPEGRFPANLIHDGSQEVLDLFPQTKGDNRKSKPTYDKGHWGNSKSVESDRLYSDSGSAARYFYCPKASKKDRDEGLDDFDRFFSPTMGNGIGLKEHDPETATKKRNTHPTVKPTALMRYLCRLITPPNGVVLDPYMGSGSTGKAAIREGYGFIGIEIDEDYHEIAKARIVA